jgi:hypothetical protein
MLDTGGPPLRRRLHPSKWIGSTVPFRPALHLNHSHERAAFEFIVAGGITCHF